LHQSGRFGGPHPHRRARRERALVRVNDPREPGIRDQGGYAVTIATRWTVMTVLISALIAGVAAQAVAQGSVTPPAPAPVTGTAPAPAAAAAPKIDTGDTAWVLMSSALVLLMTAPGLALFYGGMVRQKNALGTLMQSFIVLALISIQWV